MSSSSDESFKPPSPVLPFDYPSVLPGGSTRWTDSLPPGSSAAGWPGMQSGIGDTTTGQLQQALAQASELGRREGELAAHAVMEAQFQQERSALAVALADFAQQKRDYFRQVEIAVVELTLTIVRKILHREAQVDPLLLAGSVRVALDRLEAGTHVILRVNPTLLPVWQEYFYRSPDQRLHPELVGDAEVALDQCRVETRMGSAELGIGQQLREVEQGFADLLAHTSEGN